MNNKTVAEVIAKFRNDRINKIYQRQNIVDSLPEMQQIKVKKNQLLQEILFQSINGKSTTLNTELIALEQKEKTLLKKLNFQYHCNLCQDAGAIKGKYCACLRDLIYHTVYGAMDITTLTESFKNSDKTKFNTKFICSGGDTQSVRYTKIQNYANNYANVYPNNNKINLLLSGNTGLGKTYILRSIAKFVHNRGHDVLLIDATNLFSVFLRHRLGYDVDLKILQKCELLLLDDLGAEPISNNVTIEYLLDLLSNRIENKKHTIIATNLSTENIQNRYGERVYSRIRFKQICAQLLFEGMDIRVT